MNQHREAFTPDEIIVPPRLRSGLNEASVASLAQSIQCIGLRVPLTVRWDKDKGDDVIVLVAGRHRLEACKRIGLDLVDCVVFEGTETDARLWEIAENLHRAELTVQERAEHIAEWVRLTREKQSAQVAPIESKRADGRGHRKESGINAAVRELGIDRTEAQRAVKIASIAPEAKAAVAAAGISDNQSALLRVAAETSAENQLAAIKREREKSEAHKQNRQTDRIIALTEAEQFAVWLMERTDLNELPTIISWLEGCRPRDVIAALRREAA